MLFPLAGIRVAKQAAITQLKTNAMAMARVVNQAALSVTDDEGSIHQGSPVATHVRTVSPNALVLFLKTYAHHAQTNHT
jgi:hypothetical protein